MAQAPKSPKSGKKRPPSPKRQAVPQNAPFGAAEENAALLMGWLPVQQALKQDLDAVYARAQKLTQMARSENTRRAYRTAWRQYEDWCKGVGVEPLSGDPGTVALYLSHLSIKVQPVTLKARLAAISVAHRLAGRTLDTRHEAIRLILRGASREKGLAPKRQARPLHYSALPALMDTFDRTPLGIRDKCLVLIGFAAALRRTEIADLDIKHVTIAAEGVTITLPRAKGDRLGRGESVFVSRHDDDRLCPVKALEDWLDYCGSAPGPVFLRANRNNTFRSTGISEKTVNRIVKAHVGTLGLDASDYSGHSLRAGLATSAAEVGCDLKAIMIQTRLKSARQAMIYIRDAERRRRSVTKQLFASGAVAEPGAPAASTWHAPSTRTTPDH
ncbi:site-specific integrase [Kordiimonas gwangyangensis]|uniref:site-specific integrase n=1 Tax=Kordiimonas gwangyangensis TaxID=288022 RepID=UPI000382ACD6|nr:site-specific integrase [Kordiimonas gwangyangensis]